VSIIFPEWTNTIPRVVGAALGAVGLGAVFVVTYYFTPKFWEVGYRPVQPIAYNHQLHAGTLGIDCRYCHSEVEESGHANVPDTSTCMGCHQGEAGVGGYVNNRLWQAHETNQNLVLLRTAYETGAPVRWKRIHKLPDYAHFPHAAHVNAGISCYSCHGRIDQQEVVRQEESLAMAWCLECHRNPEKYLVDASDTDPTKFRITDLERVAAELKSRGSNPEAGLRLAREKNIQPPEHCGACHY
jgi:hypothetical protein